MPCIVQVGECVCVWVCVWGGGGVEGGGGIETLHIYRQCLLAEAGRADDGRLCDAAAAADDSPRRVPAAARLNPQRKSTWS